MKKLKLFLAACAAMVTLGVQAQSWTGNAVEAGTFYLYNVGAGKFLNVGDPTQSWGTNAYLTANFGLDVTLASAGENIYTIDTGIKNKDTEHFLNVSTWTDGAATNWTFRAVDGETNVYQIIYDGQYLMATTGLDDVEMVGDPAGRTTSTYWKLVSLNDFKTAMSSCTLSSPMDVSVFIQGRDFNRNDTRNSKWTHTNTGGNATWMGVKDNKYWGHEYWNNTFNVYQDITGLPDGVYEVSCSGFGTNGTTAIYGNKRENYISTDNTTDRGTDKEAKWVAIQDDNAFASGNTTGKFIVKGGNLRVGLQRRVNKGGDWCIFDSFRLTYYGPIPDEANDVFVGIADPNPLTKTDAWTYSADPNEADVNNNCSGFWSRTATMTQELPNLPAGYYQLTAVAFQRDGGDGTISLNDQSVTLVGCGTVNDRAGANTFFNGGNGVNNLTYHLTADGAITVGLQTNSKGDHWTIYRSFELKYLGEYPMSIKQQELADAVAEAVGLYTSLPTAAKAALKAVVDAKNTTYSTGREYSDAADAVKAAIENARPFIDPYSRYINVKNAALVISSNVATTETDAAVEAATTTAAIDAAVATLRSAFLAELPNVTVPETGLDVTAVMVDNASVRQNTNYWTAVENGSPKTNGSWAVCNYNECEFYNQNFKFYQTLALTSGTWEFGVTGFHRAGNHSTYFYAGDDKILIPGVESSVVNTMAAAQTYFNNGNGKVALKFLIEAAQNVEIGIDNKDTETDKWTIFRDFTLKYYGAPDYTVYENQWTALVEEANTAKTTHANVTGNELTALNAAIADSPAGSNLKATYTAKINALQAALQTFNAAAPSYDMYVAYKAETIALWGSDFGVAAPTTAAEAVTAVQNLNVAQYNKVASDYTFSATGLIGDFGSWTGTATVAGEAAEPNYLTNEHWSGQTHAYYEQASTGWGNANGWTIKYEKTCTLPAGSYVIKVAARSSVDVTSSVSCSATETTISLPKEGAFARGIKINGEAGWDGENSDYARNGEGFGWQWRFLPFELTAESEVTMTFYAETNKQYNWMSIADGELLSTTKLAEDVAYNENSDNTIENKIIADVTMTRNIKTGYNTVCLPFALTANQVAAAFGTGTEVYAFSENSEDANNATVNFTKGDGSITANVPVLVKATSASATQTFNGVKVVAADEAVVPGKNFDFVGVYAPMTVAEGDYFIGKDALYKSAGTTSMKAFRAYIKAKTAGGSVKMFIDGENVDAIDAINGEAAEQGAIYNIAGQRVNKAQKGIYIVNGKKVIVK